MTSLCTSSLMARGLKRTNHGGWASFAVFDKYILKCKAGFSVISNSGFEEELKVMVLTLQMASDMNCTSAMFFCDNTELIWRLQGGQGAPDILLPIIMEVVSFPRQNLTCHLKHIFREQCTCRLLCTQS